MTERNLETRIHQLEGAAGQRGRGRPAATKLRTWLATALLLFAVSACTISTPPLGPSSLTVTPGNMEGITQATVQVGAAGDWTLIVQADDLAIASSVWLSQTSGNGPRAVTLHVDPDGVPPARYRLTLWLTAEGDDGPEQVSRDVAFSFPRVYGTVVVRAGAPVRGDAEGAPPITDSVSETHTTNSDRSQAVRPTAADALVNPDGTITLLVGVQPERMLEITGEAPAHTAASPIDDAGLTLPGVHPAAAASVAALSSASVTLNFPEAGVLLVDVPANEADDAMAQLAASPGIRSVEPSIELHHMQAGYPNDFEYARQWNFGRVGMQGAWQQARGAGVTIAVIDGGFYPAHPDLAGKVSGQYDFGDDKADVTVKHSVCGTHGTHVAGIAAAATDNGIGVAGAAPSARLLLLDIDRYSAGNCSMASSDLVEALQYVYNSGSPRAQVVNMSIGSPNPLNAVEDALNTLYAAGVALVAAAGNDNGACPSNTTDPVAYPAAYPAVWAIAATGPDDVRACFSHVGSELFLAAPGGNDWYGPGDGDMVFSTTYDVGSDTADYGYMHGTSMAAPLVAGIVALMLEAAPNASLFEIEQALIDTAIDLGPNGKDSQYGYGLVRADAAVAAVGTTTPPPPDPLGLLLDVDRYPVTPLERHREFVLVDAAPGFMTIEVYSDDDGDGVPGETGEYYGSATIDVRFDRTNSVTIDVWQR